MPQKVKTLLWRACCDAMPTKESLYRRTVIEDPLCDQCRAYSKNSLHAIWSCPELESVWANLELWSFQSTVQFLDFKELLSWQILHGKNLELFAITAWSVWNIRNRVRLHQPADALHQVTQHSRAWLVDFHGR